VTDRERRHGRTAAVAEYSRLLEAYPSLDYEASFLPLDGVAERANFVLSTLEELTSVSAGRRKCRFKLTHHLLVSNPKQDD
jgi:hypothetical protein